MTERPAFLTIDDCPSQYLREKIDHLLAACIPAVLFCTGGKLQERPELAKYAIEKGFIIGNHSYNHRDFRLMSLSDCRKEIESTDEVIDRLYLELGKERPAKYFRFPFGQIGLEENFRLIQETLSELGYAPPGLAGVANDRYRAYYDLGLVSWTWTCDTMDWKLQDNPQLDPAIFLSQVFRAIDNYFSVGPGADSAETVLVHDHEASHALFPEIIKRLSSKSLRFESPL
jgi:peptidoglycan/xylan/chitin deacetylase (PgdA/CDA1 family)